MPFESFGIANFKAFGPELQSIPLKPITLVFGPNSAGKSSLLHGLLWTLEVFSRGSLDIRSSEKVSGHLDLGGFLSVLHGHAANKRVVVEIGSGSLPGGDPVRVRYELGIRTEEDFWKDVRSEHDADPRIREFLECKRRTVEVANTFLLLSHQEVSTDAEIQNALESEESWQRFLEPYHAELDERQAEDPDHHWDQWREHRGLEEMRELHFQGKDAWDRMRELGGASVIARIDEIHARLKAQHQAEGGRLSLSTLEVFFGSQSVLQAKRPPGSNDLVIDPSSVNEEAWQQIPADFASSFVAQVSAHYEPAVSTPFEGVVCKMTPDGSAKSPAAVRALPWLQRHWAEFRKAAEQLVYVGPLRALPSRQDLIGHPGVGTRDPLLAPWLRLRDDFGTRTAVNAAMQRLTGSDLAFGRAVFGDLKCAFESEDELPARVPDHDMIGRRLRGAFFNWSEERFMEAFVEFPEELLKEKPGPYYVELKEEDPGAALLMLQEHLIRTCPNDVLLDLKINAGRSDFSVTLQDVGVGISQIAPVLVQSLGNSERLIAIEQPEIHIHPRLQAELGDVFIESALGENKNTFLLETHSEHLILRLLRRIRETTRGKLPEGKLPITPADIAVLYVEPGNEGAVVRELRVNDLGHFIDEWPNGFFEDRLDELI